MKYPFLIAALLASATPSRAQCGCGKLWLAMADNRQYEYSYRVAKEGDTTKVRLLGTTTSMEPFSQKSAADRPRAVVPLPAYQTTNILVDVTDMVTHRKMQLTVKSHGLDETYRLLVDFAPGRHYQLELYTGEGKPFARFKIRPEEKSDGGSRWLKLRKK